MTEVVPEDPAPAVARAEVVPAHLWVRRLWRGALAVVGVGGAALVTLGALRLPAAASAAYALTLLLGGGAALASQWLRRRRPDWSRSVEAAASEEGLRLGDEPMISSVELTEAMVVPPSVSVYPWFWRTLGFGRTDNVWVEFKRAGFFSWPVRFATRTVEEARAIVDALGLGAGKRAVTRKVMSPVIDPKYTFTAIFGGFVAMFFAVLLASAVHPAFAVLGAWFPLGFISIFTLGFVKTKVTVGADGVSVRWLGRPTTVALDDITGVEIIAAGGLTPAVVRIMRKLGKPLDIKVGLRGNNAFEPFAVSEECGRIAERIREAIALGERAQPTEFRAWAEHRGALPIAQWVSMLRGAFDAYRDGGTVPFSADEFWALLENVRATPAERLAAAVALSARTDERTKRRLRNVALATAVPRLRVALEAAAAGDDRTLTRVLSELRSEDAVTPRGSTVAEPARVRVELPADREPAEESSVAADEAAAQSQRDEASR